MQITQKILTYESRGSRNGGASAVHVVFGIAVPGSRCSAKIPKDNYPAEHMLFNPTAFVDSLRHQTFVFKFRYLISSCSVENARFTGRVSLRASAPRERKREINRGDESFKVLKVFRNRLRAEDKRTL